MPNFDWKSLIKIDESVPADRRSMIETVLDDMASDKNGKKIFELIIKNSPEPITITCNNDFSSQAFDNDSKLAFNVSKNYTEVGGNTINLNFEELSRLRFIDPETGNLYPATLNNTIAHELAHIADKHFASHAQSYIASALSARDQEAVEDLISKIEQRDIHISPLPSEYTSQLEERFEEVIYYETIKYNNGPRYEMEAYAVKLANLYIQKFDEPQRGAYELSLDGKEAVGPVVMKGEEKLRDYYNLGSEKVSYSEVKRLIRENEAYLEAGSPNLNPAFTNDTLKDLKKIRDRLLEESAQELRYEQNLTPEEIKILKKMEESGIAPEKIEKLKEFLAKKEDSQINEALDSRNFRDLRDVIKNFSESDVSISTRDFNTVAEVRKSKSNEPQIS